MNPPRRHTAQRLSASSASHRSHASATNSLKEPISGALSGTSLAQNFTLTPSIPGRN